MPNLIDANGLQTATLDELRAQVFNAIQTIYGVDVNLDQDSPDAQLAMIYIEAALDILDLIKNVYNSVDPDLATGAVLDQRVALNGIQRKAGTYTITPVEIVTNDSGTLYGTDQTAQDPYTVADNAGTQFQLATTTNISGAGTYDLIFKAAQAGKVETIINTITVPVTVETFVVSINNPAAAISVGVNEETDVELRVRRQKSTSISSQGYKDGLEAALINVNGISAAKVYENLTGSNPDARGIPSHSIWVIVEGVYSASDVANAIYQKRNAGCGMFGANTFVINEIDGNTFVVQWDDVAVENLYISMTVSSIDATKAVNVNGIRTGLPALMSFEIGGTVNANGVACEVQGIDPNALVTSIGFSLSPTGPFTSVLTNSALNKIFQLQSANIIITPIEIIPINPTVAGGLTPAHRAFVAYGGYGSYTWSIQTDNSGPGGTPASIDSTGLYTPGTGHVNVTDTIKVVDSQGNTAYMSVEVV